METIKTILAAIGVLAIFFGLMYLAINKVFKNIQKIEEKEQVKANKLFLKQILQK